MGAKCPIPRLAWPQGRCHRLSMLHGQRRLPRKPSSPFVEVVPGLDRAAAVRSRLFQSPRPPDQARGRTWGRRAWASPVIASWAPSSRTPPM
jgi:hypothetical protein